MKPIKLSIQAFGPFAGKEEIDFTRLGDNPLFLINGPTGAGKSSILDAICFALYGQTTGAERDPSEMRCDHADLDVLTEVTLEFELGKKRYLIRRVPAQERAKSRGEGTTNQLPEAQLKELDGSAEGRLIVSKSVSDASDEVKQLIGLGVHQFRQVMVLPQGKFRELLMADSKDRETIFSQLFETHIYKKIENRLREKAVDISQAVKAHESEVKGILQSADVSSEPLLDDDLAHVQVEVKDSRSKKDSAEQSLKQSQKAKDAAEALIKRFQALDSNELALREKEQEADVFSSKTSKLELANQAQSIYHLYAAQKSELQKLEAIRRQHVQASEQLTLAEEQKERAKTEWAAANEAAAGLDGLKSKREALLRHEAANAELSKARAQLKGAQERALASEKEFLAEKKRFTDLGTELHEKEGRSTTLTEELEALTSVQLEFNSLEQKLKDSNARDSLAGEIAKLRTKLEESQKGIDSKRAVLEKSQEKTLRTEMRWHSGQAVILAQELKDDQPCPVCGSIEHPAPAESSNDESLVTKEEVEAARADENDARKALEVCGSEFFELESRLKVTLSKEQAVKESLGDYADRASEVIESEKVQASNKLKSLKEKRETLGKLNARVQQIKELRAEINEAMSLKETARDKDREESINAQSRATQIEEQVPEDLREPNALANELKIINLEIDRVSREFKRADDALKKKQTDFDQALSNEKALNRQLNDQSSANDEALSAWRVALASSRFEHDERFLDSVLDEKEQAQLKDDIDRYRTEIDSLKAVIEQLKKELSGQAMPELRKLEEDLAQKADSFKELDDAWRAKEARENQLKKLKQKLQETHESNAKLTEQYAVIGTLSEVANGSSGDKVSLQRFVLSVLLDDVLIQASRRLHLMSKGRYQLVRKEDRAKGNKASGLELEVADGNTGSSRSVATLSGGESFMAALSLALGLSDVVQSYSGGIRLDTLFIDEGFGSLDMESLDAAIKVLIDLQSSGRMIGIISHVSELKEQMGLRIDVKTGKAGSSISPVAA